MSVGVPRKQELARIHVRFAFLALLRAVALDTIHPEWDTLLHDFWFNISRSTRRMAAVEPEVGILVRNIEVGKLRLNILIEPDDSGLDIEDRFSAIQ